MVSNDYPNDIDDFVGPLGEEGAALLFLRMGGSQIYLPIKSGKNTAAAIAIGAKQVEKLSAHLGFGYMKVPLARQWLAYWLRKNGLSNNEIARIIRSDIATVGRYLRGHPKPSPSEAKVRRDQLRDTLREASIVIV